MKDFIHISTRLFTILLTAIFGCVSLYAQTSATVPAASTPSPEVRIYDDANGLSHNHITRVQQDSKGFIWVATWNGLNRFDGVEFDTFKVQPGDGNDVSNDRIRDFYMDKDGTFLCLVHETIYRFDTRTCRFSSVSPAVQRAAREKMDKQRNSNYGTPHDYTLGTTTLNGVHHEMKDRQGNIWLVGNNCVYKVEKRQHPFTLVPEVERQTVRCIYQDRNGRIWIATKNDGKGEVAVFDVNLTLIGYLGHDGQLHKQHTPFSDVYSIFHDTKDQIWLGTKHDGMYRMQASSLPPSPSLTGRAGVGLEHFLAGKTFYDIRQDNHGRIWVASFDDGICRLQDSSLPPSPSLSGRAGVGLLTSKQIFDKDYPQSCDKVRRIIFRGDTIIATTTVGLVVAYPKDKGAWQVNLHGREANRKESLSCSAVMDMFFDAKNRLVVTTESGGINILQTPTLAAEKLDFLHITHNEGLGTDVAYAAVCINGDVILQSNTEIVRFPSNDYHNPICFGRTFWNSNLHFSDTKPLLLRDGRILFSLEDGAVTAPMASLTDKTLVPHLALTCISMPDGTHIWGADYIDTLQLNANQRDVAIKYAALDYCADGDIRYATRFDQTDEWTIHSSTREITLYDLTPGTHTLEIRSTNASGIWTDNTRRLTIIVEPHFYETMTARLLLILLFAIIVAGITYTFIYIRNIKRQRQETLDAYLKLIEAKNVVSRDPDPVHVGRGFPSRDSKPKSELELKLTPEDNAFMERFMAYVEQNIANSEANLDEMAEATATSRSSLNRKTKSLLGVTPADFLKEARLKRAAQLLLTTDEAPSQVAYLCGFSDPKYFAKCFKASYGMTPKEYINAEKK